MRADDLRHRYLQYFIDRGHRRVPSSSLVPDDPTLLFTSAGMVQFKSIFAGRAAPLFPTAVSAQKCFRTTDIESVGRTAYHHTFFEMLGNFSFGEYFKEGAIRHAWEFVIDELALPEDRIWVSVYEDDDEAYALWNDGIGVPRERIRRLGKRHNWWGPVGDSGPCGPDSELFYDMGAAAACGPDCRGVACDCDRFSEIWNLVFMEFNAQPDGSLHHLERRSIDTGMGLERTAAVLQGVTSDYACDLFTPIVDEIERLAGGRIPGEMRRQRDIVADHIRGVVALLADGVLPGNERQGYVLRRILRRAVRAGQQLGLAPEALPKVVGPVVATLGASYPEIAAVRSLAQRVIAQEEANFRRTLREGEARLKQVLDDIQGDGQSVVPGAVVFELYDTFGFPAELTAEIAGERGMSVDRAGFDGEMGAQRERSRATGGLPAAPRREAPIVDGAATRFVGYEVLESEARVQHVLAGDPGTLRVVFDASPFYATSGGQVTDTGSVKNVSQPGTADVVDVERTEKGVFVHSLHVTSGGFQIGDRCSLHVDRGRRRRIERNHTATHLLHTALQRVLGEHATQAGSQVTPEELRFDFTHFEPLRAEDIVAVEDLVNEITLADEAVTTVEMATEEAVASGAAAHFADEYRGKETVRVVSVNAFSKELCGGTHVRRSGEIGLVRIVAEEGIAAGTRRIRAVTGDAVLQRMRSEESQLESLRERLGDEPVTGLERLDEELQRLRKEARAASQLVAQTRAKELSQSAERFGDVRGLVARADGLAPEALKALADGLIEELSPAVVFVASSETGRPAVVCKCSPGLSAVHAGELVREASRRLGGGGGGSPQFAQGGGSDPDAVDEVLQAVRVRLRDLLAE